MGPGFGLWDVMWYSTSGGG